MYNKMLLFFFYLFVVYKYAISIIIQILFVNVIVWINYKQYKCKLILVYYNTYQFEPFVFYLAFEQAITSKNSRIVIYVFNVNSSMTVRESKNTDGNIRRNVSPIKIITLHIRVPFRVLTNVSAARLKRVGDKKETTLILFSLRKRNVRCDRQNCISPNFEEESWIYAERFVVIITGKYSIYGSVSADISLTAFHLQTFNWKDAR